MIIYTVLKARTLDELNEKREKFKRVTKYKKIVQLRSEQPLQGTQDPWYRLHICYDDGRENQRWTTGGDSLKKWKGKII